MRGSLPARQRETCERSVSVRIIMMREGQSANEGPRKAEREGREGGQEGGGSVVLGMRSFGLRELGGGALFQTPHACPPGKTHLSIPRGLDTGDQSWTALDLDCMSCSCWVTTRLTWWCLAGAVQ